MSSLLCDYYLISEVERLAHKTLIHERVRGNAFQLWVFNWPNADVTSFLRGGQRRLTLSSVMHIIDPHIHCISRTTDDYHRMYDENIRAVVEPSFWLGQARRYPGSYFDYFALILDFEATRAARFGIDHYACIAMNPKEADSLDLAMEVVAGLGP